MKHVYMNMGCIIELGGERKQCCICMELVGEDTSEVTVGEDTSEVTVEGERKTNCGVIHMHSINQI